MNAIDSSNGKITLTCGQGTSCAWVNNAQILGDRFRTIADVKSVIVNVDRQGTPFLTVRFDVRVAPEAMLRQMAASLRQSVVPHVGGIHRAFQPVSAPAHSQAASCQTAMLAHAGNRPAASRFRNRIRKWIYGALALGSFGMAWVGLLVPGIPTVPFVILTAGFAAQADESLHRWLVNSRVIGPIMKDWEEKQAIRPEVRIQATVATFMIVAVTLLVTPSSVPVYTLIAVMLTFSLFVVWKLPVIQDDDDQKQVDTIPTIALATAV